MPSSQSFSTIHLRMLLSPEPASPVKRGEPEDDTDAGAGLIGVGVWLHLRDHVLEEEEGTVVDAGQAGAEAAVVALVVVLIADVFLLRFQLHTKRGIG